MKEKEVDKAENENLNELTCPKCEQTLKNEELRHNLYTLLSTVHHLCFLTSGQCLIFDKEGKQIGDLQAEFTSGETNIWLLNLVAEHAEKFTLGKFREWMQEMDKEDFLRVTHLHCIHDVGGSFTIDDLRKAFEAGRTVLNYKGEWQETYNDNYTCSKYEKFEDWLKDYR